MNFFFHGSRPVGQIRQISYICLLEKNFGKPQLIAFDPTLFLSFPLMSINQRVDLIVSAHTLSKQSCYILFWFTDLLLFVNSNQFHKFLLIENNRYYRSKQERFSVIQLGRSGCQIASISTRFQMSVRGQG